MLQQRVHKLHTDDAPGQRAPALSTAELYGSERSGLWPSSAASGPSQLLVLSYWGSGSSLVARLLMLMGVFAGEAAELKIGK